MSEALVPLGSIEVGDRFRRDMGDMEALAASIDHVGLLHAIVVAPNPGGQRPWLLVAGERRLRAVGMLGWERVPVRVVTTTDLLAAEHDENAVRLDFSPSEAVAIADALRPAVEAQARERERAGTPSSESDKGRSDDRLASAVGMGRTSLRQATDVVRAAEQDPTLAPLVEHMDETGKVEPAHRALRSLPEQPTPEEVQKAMASREAAIAANPEMAAEERAANVRLVWSDSWALLRKAIARLEPAYVAELEREDIEELEHDIAAVREWAEAVDVARQAARRPRLITGGDS